MGVGGKVGRIRTRATDNLALISMPRYINIVCSLFVPAACRDALHHLTVPG